MTPPARSLGIGAPSVCALPRPRIDGAVRIGKYSAGMAAERQRDAMQAAAHARDDPSVELGDRLVIGAGRIRQLEERALVKLHRAA